MNRLKDKVAIITGASSGIGRCTAKIFAAEGAKVVMLARREEALQEVKSEIEADGGISLYFAGSVCSDKDVEDCFKLAYDTFGKIDIVVNNAGWSSANSGIAMLSNQEAYELYETNTMGSMRCYREGLKYMLPAGQGTFVAVGSVGGLLGKGGAGYAMTKGGQVNLGRQVAFEYHLEGIRSNVVCPDGVRTPLLRNRPDPHVREACIAHGVAAVPLTEPEEIANVVLFLASDESSAINGQVIVADKGKNI